jgi:hypothetical protein
MICRELMTGMGDAAPSIIQLSSHTTTTTIHPFFLSSSADVMIFPRSLNSTAVRSYMKHSGKNKIPPRRKQTIGEAKKARQERRERK